MERLNRYEARAEDIRCAIEAMEEGGTAPEVIARWRQELVEIEELVDYLATRYRLEDDAVYAMDGVE